MSNKDDMREIATRLGSIDTTLAKQELTLAEHIRRTELIEQDMIPIKAHVQQVNGALKLIGLISLVTGVGAALVAMGLRIW